jgi:hypothetical protein
MSLPSVAQHFSWSAFQQFSLSPSQGLAGWRTPAAYCMALPDQLFS